MLQDEDSLLQKTITVDFFTHKWVKNEGQVPQFFVENSYSAITPDNAYFQASVKAVFR